MGAKLPQGFLYRLNKLIREGHTLQEIAARFGISVKAIQQMQTERENELDSLLTVPRTASQTMVSSNVACAVEDTLTERQLPMPGLTHLIREARRSNGGPRNVKTLVSNMPQTAGLRTEWSKRLSEQLKASQIRREEMAKLRDEGYTLQQIGDKFNISRERVRQILVKVPPEIREGSLLSLRQAAAVLKCNTRTLLELVESGVLKPASKQVGRILFRESDLRSVRIPIKTCIICGHPIPQRRRTYCSPDCFRERWEYRNWTDERKRKHRQAMANWSKNNPEQARLIQSRTSHRYQRKVRKLREFDRMARDISSLQGA